MGNQEVGKWVMYVRRKEEEAEGRKVSGKREGRCMPENGKARAEICKELLYNRMWVIGEYMRGWVGRCTDLSPLEVCPGSCSIFQGTLSSCIVQR